MDESRAREALRSRHKLAVRTPDDEVWTVYCTRIGDTPVTRWGLTGTNGARIMWRWSQSALRRTWDVIVVAGDEPWTRNASEVVVRSVAKSAALDAAVGAVLALERSGTLDGSRD